MPLHEVHCKHWLPFDAYLTLQHYFVYDSASPTADDERGEIVRNAVCVPALVP